MTTTIPATTVIDSLIELLVPTEAREEMLALAATINSFCEEHAATFEKAQRFLAEADRRGQDDVIAQAEAAGIDFSRDAREGLYYLVAELNGTTNLHSAMFRLREMADPDGMVAQVWSEKMEDTATV